jgi:hypothetical protein
MKGYKAHRRGTSTGTCRECSVEIPRSQNSTLCRCCAAELDYPEAFGPDSVRLMPPPPTWTVSTLTRFPRLETGQLILTDGSECNVALWWLPKGNRWVPQHPLEYPHNRLKNLTDGVDQI